MFKLHEKAVMCLAEEAERRLRDFNAQNLANTVTAWALATANQLDEKNYSLPWRRRRLLCSMCRSLVAVSDVH